MRRYINHRVFLISIFKNNKKICLETFPLSCLYVHKNFKEKPIYFSLSKPVLNNFKGNHFRMQIVSNMKKRINDLKSDCQYRYYVQKVFLIFLIFVGTCNTTYIFNTIQHCEMVYVNVRSVFKSRRYVRMYIYRITQTRTHPPFFIWRTKK